MIKFVKKIIRKSRNSIFVLKVLNKYKKDIIVWIYPHIGDMFYALPYINCIKRNGKKIILIGNEKYLCYYKLFEGIDSFCALTEKKVFSFCCVNNFEFVNKIMIKKIKNNSYISNDFDLVKRLYPIQKDESLNHYTKRCIYKIDDTIECKYPIIKGKNLSEKPYIIISPYAQSAKMIDITEYENLVNKIKKMNVDVYTNVYGEETIIKGTKRLDCSLLELASFAKKAICFIGIRSGICDLLAALTNVPMFVFFNNYGLGKFATICDFRKSDDNIFEIYDKSIMESSEAILERVKEYVEH